MGEVELRRLEQDDRLEDLEEGLKLASGLDLDNLTIAVDVVVKRQRLLAGHLRSMTILYVFKTMVA